MGGMGCNNHNRRQQGSVLLVVLWLLVMLALLPLGHPTGKWGVAPRYRGPERITSWNAFGEKRTP